VTRLFNFVAGPSALPTEVLESAQSELLDYAGTGKSILETSHRSPEFMEILDTANARLTRLLGIPETHVAVWMHGGASAQFAMVPMNFLPEGQTAAYVLTGVWSKKALREAQVVGDAVVAASTEDRGFDSIPDPAGWDVPQGAAYLHLTSNNTIYGTQFATLPERDGVPLVCDMSSDFLSRPIDVSQFALIYAGAQKNLGPAGVTLAIVDRGWLETARTDIPHFFRYQTHVDGGSLYNTPCVFAIYMTNKVLEWVEAQGGAEAMAARNGEKARRLYAAIDARPDFYRGLAASGSRSQMNVVWRLPSEALEKAFVAEAKAAGLLGLKGHRTVGGIRASLYNAVGLDAVDALTAFMGDFVEKNG
jgi:phosphoserine aminotransferase